MTEAVMGMPLLWVNSRVSCHLTPWSTEENKEDLIGEAQGGVSAPPSGKLLPCLVSPPQVVPISAPARPHPGLEGCITWTRTFLGV